MMQKPFAESCEQNKHVILDVISRLFTEPGRVLEIGSGTGQHAVFFADALSHLHWQPTDQSEYLSGIDLWLSEARLANILPLQELDVLQQPWAVTQADYVFSANTAHIMSWPAVEAFFSGVGNVLASGGLFALYGPFNYQGQYTSPSNAQFDQWLKQRDPASGIRDIDDLQHLAGQAGLQLDEDVEMPVNNRILVWKKY